MRRAAVLVSGLLTLGAVGALSIGMLMDTARVRMLIAALPWAAPSTPERPVSPVPVSIAKAEIADVPIYLSGIGAVQAYNRFAGVT